ncbi:hypothetical protein A3768_3614 [Ralstonia solanacearum]|nr:hypothetical protein A3768_3614 [Ralstonia solanacearum]
MVFSVLGAFGRDLVLGFFVGVGMDFLSAHLFVGEGFYVTEWG